MSHLFHICNIGVKTFFYLRKFYFSNIISIHTLCLVYCMIIIVVNIDYYLENTKHEMFGNNYVDNSLHFLSLSYIENLRTHSSFVTMHTYSHVCT